MLFFDNVLILILMEHAQRGGLKLKRHTTCCLNPYFNGTCSKRVAQQLRVRKVSVLILILMEHAQRETLAFVGVGDYLVVLILILMEHAQRV